MPPVSVVEWTSPAFIEAATTWVRTQAATNGLTLTGEWEQPHARPWSSAIRYETDAGRVWFKVNGRGTAFEGSVVAVLSRLAPTFVPPVLAVDPDRGWSLLADVGPVLRSVAPPVELIERWCAIVRQYAATQLDLAPHVEQVEAAGYPVVGPDEIPVLARELTDELSALPVEEGGLTSDENVRLEAMFPELDAWCEELAASGIPTTINHDDMHSNNVCWVESRDVPERVIDWGDGCVGHPFGTMLATLNSISYHAGLDMNGPEVTAVLDAYLEPFEEFADAAQLRHLVGLARRSGAVSRALSYQRAVEGEPVSVHVEHEFPVRGWLLELLQPPTFRPQRVS